MLAAVALSACFPARLAAADNLAPNPGAEEVRDGKPAGWGVYDNTPVEWGVSTAEFHSGARSAYVKVVGASKGMVVAGFCVGESNGFTAPGGIPVEPDTDYHYAFQAAGFGCNRAIGAEPWGFDADGKSRDRNLPRTTFSVEPRWKRFTGTFKTGPATRKIALMFFFYGNLGRDYLEGATLYIDDVYIGKRPPPPPPPPSGRPVVEEKGLRKTEGPAGEGYSALPAGAVRLWDTRRAYGPGLNMNMSAAWKERGRWHRIAEGQTPERIDYDVVLEGPNFHFNITWRPDTYLSGPVLYAKTGDDAAPGRHNLLYRGFFTPRSGLWDGGGNLGYIQVLKNTAADIVVRAQGREGRRDGITRLTADYRVQAGKPWLEVAPVNQCSWIGMHGESRFNVCPGLLPGDQDFVYDSMKNPPNHTTWVPEGARMLYDFIMDDDTIWLMAITPAAPDADPASNHMPPSYRKRRFHVPTQKDGFHAGWSHIGEGSCDNIVTAPYGVFLGRKIAIGVLRIGYWHYQKVDADVSKGSNVTIDWRVAYTKAVRNSPFEPGGAWRPMHPGQWRLVCRIGGEFHTVPVAIGRSDTARTRLTFRAPASGRLEYVLFYLHDRSADTPAGFYTPMDIYREAIEGRPLR
jgi:hypothetical protein